MSDLRCDDCEKLGEVKQILRHADLLKCPECGNQWVKKTGHNK